MAKATPTPVPDDDLEPSDIEALYELETTIAALEAKRDALKARFKSLEEFTQDDLDINGHKYTIKRWDQIGALKEDEFIARFPIENFPEFTTPHPDIERIKELAPPDEYPDLWVRKVDPALIKEAITHRENGLTDDDKLTLFKQVPYLKITRK